MACTATQGHLEGAGLLQDVAAKPSECGAAWGPGDCRAAAGCRCCRVQMLQGSQEWSCGCWCDRALRWVIWWCAIACTLLQINSVVSRSELHFCTFRHAGRCRRGCLRAGSTSGCVPGASTKAKCRQHICRRWHTGPHGDLSAPVACKVTSGEVTAAADAHLGCHCL